MPAEMRADVVVVGSGPAGRAVAHECCRQGLDSVIVAPNPHVPWRQTYGLWEDQSANLPAGADVARAATVWADGRRLAREYVILDNASVLAAYGGARVVAGTVVSATTNRQSTTVTLRSGQRVAGTVVVDASGQRRLLSGGPPRGARVEQTAYGVVVPGVEALPLVDEGEAIFMRWDAVRPVPTFLYAVPLPGGLTLLEETSLAHRPGLPMAELKVRLEHRLAAAGVPVTRPVGTERVRFAVDVPMPWRRPGVVAFGVAAGMLHPATGYSVGEVLASAPAVAEAIAGDIARGPVAVARAAHAAVWSPAARAVRMLRGWGLRTLLTLPPRRVPEFFEGFFALSDELQRAYLSGREDVSGTSAAMAAMFRAAPGGLRMRMALGGLSAVRRAG